MLLKIIKEQDRLFARFLKTRQPEYVTGFKKVRNKLGRDLKMARERYYENKFAHILNDPKKVWQTLNNLLPLREHSSVLKVIDNGVSFTGTSLADKFNQHFLKCGASDAFDAESPNYKSYIWCSVSISLFLAPTVEAEINSLFLKLKNSTACDVDGIKVEPIKVVAMHISEPMPPICNLILCAGSFPS